MRMSKVLKYFLLLVIGAVSVYFISMAIRKLTVGDEETRFVTDHFVITYRGIYANDVRRIGVVLEQNYDRIRNVLIDPPHDTIHVFIHPDQQSFNDATGLINSTANGTSRGPNAFHFIWTNWFNSIFPDDPEQTAIHEFTHCVQLNILIQQALMSNDYENDNAFVAAFEKRFAEAYPQWLWEAICTFEAGELNRLSVWYGMRSQPTLRSLNNSNQVYNVGYTIMEYVATNWGEDKFPELIREYGDLQKVLGVTEDEFEKGWWEFVEAKY